MRAARAFPMNAMLREKHEVPVVAEQSQGFEEFKADIRELRAADAALAVKIDALGAKADAVGDKVESVHITLREKIESVHDTMRDKIDSVNTTLSNKIDSVHITLRDWMDEGFPASNAKFEKLDDKLSQLITDVAKIGAMQKAMLWLIGCLGTLATIAATVGKALNWF
jgi:uncharacterized coiled-coil DUF342 family protein